MKQLYSYTRKVRRAFADAQGFAGLIAGNYSVSPVTTTALEASVLRLRHDVYCAEYGYLEASSSQLETDKYDGHSVQLALQKRGSPSVVGCMRFITGDDVPMAIACPEVRSYMKEAVKSGEGLGEVSRLAIAPSMRHMGRSGALPAGISASASFLALMVGLLAFTHVSQNRHLFAIVEDRLHKKMLSLRIPAKQIGQAVDFHGTRLPILIDRDEAMNAFPTLLQPVYNRMHRHISTIISGEQAPQVPVRTLPARNAYTFSESSPH